MRGFAKKGMALGIAAALLLAGCGNAAETDVPAAASSEAASGETAGGVLLRQIAR